MPGVRDIAWLAGILEGEGLFRFETSPRITLKMTDEDTVSRARDLMCSDAKIFVYQPSGRAKKTAYVFHIHGNLAIQWMMTIYSLMGRRRKEKIREIFTAWKNQIWTKGPSNRQNEKMVKMVAISRKISMEEARKFLHEAMEKIQ